MVDSRTKRARKPLIAFLSIIVIAALTLGIGVALNKTSFKPKLALDLEGGTQLVLTPQATAGKIAQDGRTEVTNDDLNQAIEVIRQRIDSSGVAEAEITSQGGQNIVVSLPGKPSEETLNLVRKSALMEFRSVLAVSGEAAGVSPQRFADQVKQLEATTPETPKGTAEPTPGKLTPEQHQQALQQARELSKLDAEQIATRLADANGDGKISDEPKTAPENNSDDNLITERVMYDYYLLDCTDPAARNDAKVQPEDKAIAACGESGLEKFILSPVDIHGAEIKNAFAATGQTSAGSSDGQWGVDLTFNRQGTEQFTEVTSRLTKFRQSNPTKNRFAVVLDGIVISAPGVEQTIPGGSARISGNFDVKSATTLANQLNFGSLPLSFKVESEQQISATLGSDHLEKGLWAGLIGLLLVILYLAWSYHGLSLVALGSLTVAAIATYLSVALLSWGMGYRLSLPGVTGLIISIGITADSFIVYFERIRDEVREGATLRDAVDTGWKHAKHTILISDAVNILAAVILYVLAVGGVQGFAFTLGLTTLIDLAVIFLFTHPIMVLLLNIPFFGEGRRWSGFDPETLGARTPAYAGRGRIRTAEERKASNSIAQRRAERKAAQENSSATLDQEEVN